jgi:hypothetical protein
MIGNFPDVDVSEAQKVKNDYRWAKDFIDAAISFFETSFSQRKANIQNLYDSHNGIIKEIDRKFIVERYGATSVVPFVDFKLGRTKIKLLLGEYLNINFDPKVSSVNPEAVTKKLAKSTTLRGAMILKEELDGVKKRTNIKPLNGVEIPSQNDPNLFNKLYPKTRNEVIMQTILDNELKDGKVKMIGYENLANVVITSECHTKITRDTYGKEIIETIDPKYRIFQESRNDPFAEKTPFSGHMEYMYIKDILQKFELSEQDKIRIKAAEADNHHEDRKSWEIINGIPCIPVYFLQWKSIRSVYTKVKDADNGPEYLVDVEEKEYEKTKDKFQYSVKYYEDLWEGVRIGQNAYTGIRRVEGQIQTRDFLNRVKAEYDYNTLLFGTVDGIRLSLQELINGLSAVYNVIMYQIVREIRKMKGKVFTYDESLRPAHKTMKSVLYDIEEHGVLRWASSSEQNYGKVDVDNAVRMILELDLGLSQSFKTLLEVKYNIENTIDKITGINENREGMGKASQTATGANQSIDQSRSITKDLFYCHNLFMQETLRKLLEKRKTNWEWINSMAGQFLLGSVGLNHLNVTREITNDDYGVVLSDGRKEEEIRQKAEKYFEAEINSGSLRTKDVLAFEKSRSLDMGLKILEDAWETIQKVAQEQTAAKERISQNQLAAQQQLAKEDREDWQAHEIELQRMKLGESMVKLGAQGMSKDNTNQTNQQIAEEGNEI